MMVKRCEHFGNGSATMLIVFAIGTILDNLAEVVFSVWYQAVKHLRVKCHWI